MDEQQLISLISNSNTPLSVILIIYLFFKLNRLENAINKLEGKVWTILTLINDNKNPKNGSKREDTSENDTEQQKTQ